MPRDRLPALIRWLAARLPTRQALREAEWLAELESLSTASARWGFVLGCALATVRLQPGAGMLRAGSALMDSRRWRRALSVRESDVLALQRAENVGFVPALSGALTGSDAGSADRRVPEVDLPPFNFSGLPEQGAAEASSGPPEQHRPR